MKVSHSCSLARVLQQRGAAIRALHQPSSVQWQSTRSLLIRARSDPCSVVCSPNLDFNGLPCQTRGCKTGGGSTEGELQHSVGSTAVGIGGGDTHGAVGGASFYEAHEVGRAGAGMLAETGEAHFGTVMFQAFDGVAVVEEIVHFPPVYFEEGGTDDELLVGMREFVEHILHGQVVQALVLFVLFELRGILATCQRMAHHGKRLAASGLPVRKDAGPSSLNTPGSRLCTVS